MAQREENLVHNASSTVDQRAVIYLLMKFSYVIVIILELEDYCPNH